MDQVEYTAEDTAQSVNGEASDIVSFSLPPLFTVDNVKEVAVALSQGLPPSTGIMMLDASQTHTVTIAAIQLVLSAARTVEQSGALFLITKLKPAVRQAFQDAGLSAWLMQREAS